MTDFAFFSHTGEKYLDKEYQNIFVEKISSEEGDWHPVDDLPLRKEYIKELQKIMKEEAIPVKNNDIKTYLDRL